MYKIPSLTVSSYDALVSRTTKLTDSESRLHRYILSHFNEMVYCGIIDLANNVNVSKATIGRFLNKLGFLGFSDFKRAIEQGIKPGQLQSPIDVHYQNENIRQQSIKEITQNFLSSIQGLLNMFNTKLNIGQMEELVDLLMDKQRRIFVVGPSSSFAMAKHFSTLIKYIRNDIYCLSLDTSELPKQLLNIRKNDILIVFSYYRFNNVVIKLTQWFKQKNAAIVLITNTGSNPYGKFADIQFILPSEANTIFQSRIIGFYFIELLLFLCYEKDTGEGNFYELEELFRYFNTFSIKH